MKSPLLALLSDRIVAYHPALARAVGGVKPALMLSQLLYWDGKQSSRDGWIYKSDSEMECETGMSEREISGARRDLVDHGFVEAQRRGVPARMNYRINAELVLTTLQNKLCEKRGTSSDKSAELVPTEAQDLFLQKRGTITEITTETTQEITHKNTHTNARVTLFDEAWSLYPKREGGNSRKAAFEKWTARVREGANEQELLDGVKRYLEYCRTKNIIGTAYVKQASSFFGTSEHWKEPWVVLPNGQYIDERGARRDKDGYAIPVHEYAPKPIYDVEPDPVLEELVNWILPRTKV